jgi:hypothetical protein
MANFTNIPFASPVKFYRYSLLPGIHLDDTFAYSQIKPFETKVCYKGKWQTNDKTPLQIESTIPPSSVLVYTGAGKQLPGYSFVWTLVGSGGDFGVNLYECLIDFTVLPEGYYHLAFEATLLSYSVVFISEKLDVRILHKNTLLFSYKNSFNNFGVFFNTGIIYNYRCEAGLMDYQPVSEGKDYVNQIRDTTLLSSYPYDTFKLYIGEAPGVPNYVIKILNYIFACDYVNIRRDLADVGQLFVKQVSEKWEATRVKGYPNFGWVTTVQPSLNLSSLQYTDNTEIAPGVHLVYNIDTNLFSTEPVMVVHITESKTG